MPEVNGQRGNPIVLSGQAMGEDLGRRTKRNCCRKYMDTHPELISHYKTDNEHFIADVDTKEDLAALSTSGVWADAAELGAVCDRW